jgi:hypothetical protein
MPEVRALPSTDITRLQRYYDPLRLPSGPPCVPRPRRWVSARPQRVSPAYPQHLSNVPCPIPRWTETGATVGFFPVSRGLPRSIGGSASTLPLSRPAQASHSLRPAGLLSRLTRPLSQGFDPVSYPAEPPVSYQTFRLLSGWILPPLVLRALGAHYGFRAREQSSRPGMTTPCGTPRRPLRSRSMGKITFKFT